MEYDVSDLSTLDENLKQLVVDELYWDSRVDASKVKVEVDRGIVTLSGHVPTVADRYSAEADARLVKNVITVDNPIEDTQPEIIPDRELQDTVTKALDWTPDIETEGLEISVKAGTVTLRGTVPTYWQKLRAHLKAAKIRGVIHVLDEIAVTPRNAPEDRWIADTLEHFVEHRFLDDVNSIQISVDNGVVTLRGQVASVNLKQEIQNFTERTAGVTGIHNELTYPKRERTAYRE